jgi:hypothetical protein
MKELEQRLSRIKDELKDYPKWADVHLGLAAFAFITNRIVTRGESAEGGSFSPYSTKPMLVGAKSFRTKAAAASVFERKNIGKNQWRTIQRNSKNYRLILLPNGYKELRRIEGSGTAFKTFLRTGEMWGSSRGVNSDNMPAKEANAVKVEGTVENAPGKYITTVGSKSELTNKKLEGHNKREGKDLLMLSAKEEKALTDVFDKYITNIVERLING